MMRIIRNYRLFRVDRLLRKGKLRQARDAALSLLGEDRESPVYNLLLADVLLVSGEIECAREQYIVAGRMLDRSKKVLGENKRYLQAYKNFRIAEIDFYRADKEFEQRKEIIDLIDEIAADRPYRRLFSLPN